MAATACGGRTERVEGADAFVFGAGVEPAVLLEFSPSGTAPSPQYCMKSGELLSHIKAAIASGSNGQCTATLDPRNVLMTECTLHPDDNVPGCQLTFSGTMWAEQIPNTTMDYQLLSFGWIHRSCKMNRSYAIDENLRQQIMGGGGAAVRTIVNTCSGSHGSQ